MCAFAPVCEVENKYVLWHSVNTLTSLRALFTIEGTNLPVQTANSTRQSGLGGIAWLYWIWPPGYRYMISTYLFALTEHVHSEASSLLLERVFLVHQCTRAQTRCKCLRRRNNISIQWKEKQQNK